MPTELKQLAGTLDLDSPLESIGKVLHRDARNVEFDGVPPNRRVKVKAGNLLLANPLLPIVGVNKNIGNKYDTISKRIYVFNYNSSGNHGIYVYNTIPKTFQRLIEVGINTTGDPLAFTANILYNIDVIYGDSTQGDILYFVDSIGRPTKINIDRALASGYGSIQRSYIDVAKEPADIPPYVVYENDASSIVNNLRKKIFRFKTRWDFDDHDKSITSSQSEMPIPYNAFDQTTDADPTKNCRIAITYQTGPANVRKVELMAAHSFGNVMSDWYVIASIDKDAEGIPDNDIATYLFYNDKGYNNILIAESDQLQDYVPQACIAQALLNGNTLDYGNVTEGYPNLTDFSFNGNTSNITQSDVTPYYSGVLFSNLIANQDGKSGFGTGVIHIVVRGTVQSPSSSLDDYVVYLTNGSTVSYSLSTGDDAAAVIEGLRVDALSQGYTIISSGPNDLYISKAGISLARTNILSDYSYNSTINTSFPAYDWSSRHGYAIVYFDEKYRTNGAVYTSGFSVTSLAYLEASPTSPFIQRFLASIYHQPPDWAYYFQWVRTKDLSKQTFVQWISDRTFKDTVDITGIVKYAYFSIESLNAFVNLNPGSPLAYGFTPGDRVKVMKRYNGDGSTANIYGDVRDYEVVASVINPAINGEAKSGQFIKIILPPTDGSFDFGTGYDNYFIEIYTPARPVANNLNLYYEFGQRYAIANPTLSNRFHQGMLQNQTSNYATPATYEFFKGDFYIKNRAIQTGNVYRYSVTQGSTGSQSDTFLIGLNFTGSTYTDSNVTAQSAPLANLGGSFDPPADSRWFLKAVASTTFKISGTITLTFGEVNPGGDAWRIYLQNIYTDQLNLVGAFDASEGAHTFTINSSITLENDRIFLIAASVGSKKRSITFSASELTFTIDHVISQKCIDPNFSDYYQSAVNSNGREWIFDENANRVTYPTMHRWSMPYQEDTNVNQTSRFYPENFDTVDRSKGGIMRMSVWDRVLTFFQERKCGQTGIYSKYIASNDGNNQVVTTDGIITKNNVQYYAGEYGVGSLPMSVVQSGFVYYGVDPIKNVIWRLSRDGMTDLSELYKVKTWASDNLPKYLNPGDYEFGGKQKVLGTFNIRPDNVAEYLLLAQGTQDAPGEVFAFEESYNSFYSKIDIDADSIICAENKLYAFKNGELWEQSSDAFVSNFFGVQYTPSITVVFNESEAVKKVFNAISYQSNKTWAAPTKGDIATNRVNSQTLVQQESLIMEEDFDILENPSRYAAFNRDQNSMSDEAVALWEGDYMTGNIIIVKLSYSGNTDSYLYAPYVTWKADPRNL